MDTSEFYRFQSPDKANFMEYFVIPEALALLQRVLQVRSPQIIPSFPAFDKKHRCYELDERDEPLFTFRSTHHRTGLQADFLLYVAVVNEPSNSFYAKASFCNLGECRWPLTTDETTQRPLVGVAILNEPFVRFDDGDYQNQIATFIHEVFHALFFDPVLFKKFPPNSDGQSFLFKDERSRWKLRGDNVLYFLRIHSMCDGIDGGRPG